MGHDFGYETTEDVFDDLAAKIPGFSGMNYEIIDTLGAVIGQTEEVLS
jgi:predicted molibdopterin-dependent oxidoreductase YjgC